MYKSSIVHKYGDTDNVKADVKTLNEILGRQGTQLLIDVIAEYAGISANKFKMQADSRIKLAASLVADLKDAINERV